MDKKESNPAVVGWSVRASGNNAGLLQAVDQIPLGAWYWLFNSLYGPATHRCVLCGYGLLGVKFMFISVMNFSKIKKIRFIVVKIYWSTSNQFLVFLIWPSELASY